jgi:hypothetical protein
MSAAILALILGVLEFALGYCLGVLWERRSAHEAWGAPRPIGELSDESQAKILAAIYDDYPRPPGAARRGSRSRVSVDREGPVERMQLSDFGRFAGEAET